MSASFMNRGLQQQMEHLDPRRQINRLSSSTNEAINAWNKRRTRCEPVPIQHIGSIELIETSQVSKRADIWARPSMGYTYSQSSTISRSSSSGSGSDSDNSAKRGQVYKLPKLKRKPVPSYFNDEDHVKDLIPIALIDETNNELGVVLIEQEELQRSSSSASESSPRDYDSSGTFSSHSRRTSISSTKSALSLGANESSSSSVASQQEETASTDKMSARPTIVSRRSSSLNSNDDPATPVMPVKSPMSKRKPVPYYDLSEMEIKSPAPDTSIPSHPLKIKISGEDGGEEKVVKKDRKKSLSRRKVKSSKKSILIAATSATDATTATKQDKMIRPPRPSRRDPTQRSGEMSPVLSECSFHTAGGESEKEESDNETISPSEDSYFARGCKPHHSGRVYVSKNKRGKSKYYVIPPRTSSTN